MKNHGIAPTELPRLTELPRVTLVIDVCQFRMCSYLFKDSLGDLFVLMPGSASKRQLVANEGNFTDFSNTVYNAEIEVERKINFDL